MVLGIVIALTAEQIVQGFDWRHQSRLAEQQMRVEITLDDGPQVQERIALSPCVGETLDAIQNAIERDAVRAKTIDAISRFWTPRHTWDNIAFQAASASGVLGRMPATRINVISRFYSLMPVLEGADERESHDRSALFLSRSGDSLSPPERDRVLGAVEALRQDNAEIVRLATLAKSAMQQLGLESGRGPLAQESPRSMQDPERVLIEMQNHPMAQRCIPELKTALGSK